MNLEQAEVTEMAGSTKAQQMAALERQAASVAARKRVIEAKDALAKAKAAAKAARMRGRSS